MSLEALKKAAHELRDVTEAVSKVMRRKSHAIEDWELAWSQASSTAKAQFREWDKPKED